MKRLKTSAVKADVNKLNKTYFFCKAKTLIIMVYFAVSETQLISTMYTVFYHHTSCIRQISYKSLLLRVGDGEQLSFHIFVEIPVTPPPPCKNWTRVSSDSKSNSPFWGNWTFARKTETLGSLCCRAVLIPAKSFKSKNQVMHKKMFKDPLRSKCQISSERRVLDLESEVNQRPGFNPHWGQHFSLDFFFT